MGHQPVWHDQPFIMSASVAFPYVQEHLMREIVADIKGAATDISCYPHYQTFWVHTGGHTMTPDPQKPIMLSRTWIHERNGGLNWLTAMQIADAADMPQVIASTWGPFPFRSQPKPQLQ